MRRVFTILRVLVIVLFLGLLHYVLPQHDIARITSTEVIRADFSGFNRLFYAQADSGAAELTTRDLRLINTEKRKTWLLGFIPRESTEVMVYRNEDSGWIWPPYFKFDSSDLQAEAASQVSTAAAPQWVVVTHYGWRNRFFSIYPNAVGIRPVSGPDVSVVPWFNIGFFILLIAGIAFIRAAWYQFRERTMDPLLDQAENRMDEVNAGIAERRSRVRRWFDSWRSKH
jgi:hypothetical protein